MKVTRSRFTRHSAAVQTSCVPDSASVSARPGASNTAAAFASVLQEASRRASPESAAGSPAFESGAATLQATTALAAVLSLHEAEAAGAADATAAAQPRQAALTQAHSLLDRLEALRRDLLHGAVPGHRLHDLEQQMMALKDATKDPVLQDILGEIELRAAVELAKLEAAAQASNAGSGSGV